MNDEIRNEIDEMLYKPFKRDRKHGFKVPDLRKEQNNSAKCARIIAVNNSMSHYNILHYVNELLK